MRLVLFIILVCTFCLINLGGLVHNTGSSLACPDWPLCYGQIMPEMTGGILVEHSHRLLGSLVGFLVIINLILTIRKTGKWSLSSKLSWLALFMVIFQGVLGGLTVIYQLPTLVSTLHLATSMLVICLIYLLFRNTWENKIDKSQNKNTNANTWPKNLRWFVGLSLILVYAQIVLGALMRHLGLGGACGVGPEHYLVCFDMINNHSGPFPSSQEAWVHAIHRYFAIILGVFILAWTNFYNSKLKKLLDSEISKAFTKRIIIINSILILQILLGIFTVVSEIGITVTTLHLGGATVLLIALFEMFMYWRAVETNFGTHKIISTFSDWFSLTKPRLSSLVLCTSLLGIMLAPGEISIIVAASTMFGLYLVVSGACMMNCYAERDVDKFMERTKNRALPAGRIQANHCFLVSIALCVTGILLLYVMVNPLSAILCTIASLLYVFLYTPLKRHSPIALFVGAIPGAIPPLVGWVSVTNEMGFWGLLLFGILFVWQLPHFLAIAIFHAKDYEKAGIKILPNTLGVQATKIRIFIYSALLVAIALLPVYLEKSMTTTYVTMTLILGAVFIFMAFKGLMIRNKQLELTWSRNYFWSTLFYLPIQLGFLVMFS
jgi:protoheme IX farnesyltransferase